MQTELDQLKQLLDLLQEKKESELISSPNVPSPSHIIKTLQNEENLVEKQLQNEEKPKIILDLMKKKNLIEINLPKIENVGNNEEIFEKINENSGRKTANISKIKNSKKSGLIKTASLSKKMSIFETKKPDNNERKESELQIPKQKTKEFDSKECNTDEMFFSNGNNYNFNKKIAYYLTKIDFSKERNLFHLENFLGKYLNEQNIAPEENGLNNSKIETNEMGIQTEIDDVYIHQIDNSPIKNPNLYLEEAPLQKKLKNHLQITESTIPQSKKLYNSIDFNELLNSSKISTKLDISNFESQKAIPNKNKNNNEIIEKINNLDQKSSISKSIPLCIQKNLQITLPFLNTSLENSSEFPSNFHQKEYFTPQSFIERIKNQNDKDLNKTLDFQKKLMESNNKSIVEGTNPVEENEKFMKWKQNDKEVIEEVEEQSIIAKEVFEHLNKNTKNVDKNYSKFKHFFNYPFRKIEDFSEINKSENLTKNILNNTKDDFSFETFKLLFDRLVKAHQKCGRNCKHLKRFYKTIGFVRNSEKKQMLEISKKIINKLPKI